MTPSRNAVDAGLIHTVIKPSKGDAAISSIDVILLHVHIADAGVYGILQAVGRANLGLRRCGTCNPVLRAGLGGSVGLQHRLIYAVSLRFPGYKNVTILIVNLVLRQRQWAKILSK